MRFLTKIKKGCVIACMMPLMCFLRLIRPLIRVRFIEFPQESPSIIYSFYRYFEEKSWDYLPKKNVLPLDVVIVFGSGVNALIIINKFVVKLEKRVCFSLRFYWFTYRFAHKFICYLTDFEKVFGEGWIIRRDIALPDPFCSVKYPPIFHFRSKEVREGEKYLEKFFQYKNDMPIATFSNRDKAFYTKYIKVLEVTTALANNCRDSSIKDFYEAIIKTSEKYFCFRMGKLALEPLGIEKENVIDYPNSKFKSDFLDFYIFARTKFYIGDDSGINYIPYAFRRKMGIVNCPVFTVYSVNAYKFYSHLLNNSCIIKKYYSIKENRLLNLSEIVSIFIKNDKFDIYSGLAFEDYGRDYIYETLGVKVIGNTPQEILDLTLEVEKRASDEWEEDYDHFKREDEFWKIMGAPYKSKDRFLFPRIGYQYLKENEWLLQ
ncbi:MAG: TIGR04372 family glycosyltransferase [Holosporales bacterium]|jgi:putative glycosyltransferase (TIGR04372 family)|nr:TIGR04372 family glycosyltransferase [Holosporales bacterium]